MYSLMYEIAVRTAASPLRLGPGSSWQEFITSDQLSPVAMRKRVRNDMPMSSNVACLLISFDSSTSIHLSIFMPCGPSVKPSSEHRFA